MNRAKVDMSNVTRKWPVSARTCALAGLLFAAMAPLSPATAHADASEDDAESLVLIRPLTGPGADELQITVEAAVAEYFSAVSASPAEEKELAAGTAALVSMSREKKYRAYVSGVVKKGPKGYTLVLTVHSGKDGSRVGEAKFPGPTTKALDAKVDKQAGKVLANLLKRTQVAGDEEPEAKGKVSAGTSKDGKEVVTLEEEPEGPTPSEEPDEEEEEQEPEGPPPSPLDVHAGVGFMNLALSYNEPVFDSFGFQLQERPSTPLTIRLGGNVYPGAFVRDDLLADLGVSARFYQSFGGSIGVNGVPFDVLFRELDVGLRGRIRLPSMEVGFGLGWGQTRAFVEGDNETFANRPDMGKDPGLFPDMQYSYIRVGGDVRAHVTGPVSLLGGLALRLPSIGDKRGQLGEERWFPRASASGVDLELAGLYEFMPRLSATLGVDARIYGLTMHSTSEDIGVSSVAGGAQDRYLGGFVGVDYRL